MKKITGVMALVLLIIISAAFLVLSMLCIWTNILPILVEKIYNTILVLAIWMILSFIVNSSLEQE